MPSFEDAKDYLRQSPLAYAAARQIYGWLPGWAGLGKSEVRTLEELDHRLGEIERECENDHMRLRKELRKIAFRCAEVEEFAGLDPFSDPYRERVIGLQARLHGKPYDVAREGLAQRDIDQRVRWQTPFGQPPSVVGPYLIAYGFLIEQMNLPVGSRVLEIGCGEGGLSYLLAKTGYHLTCVEVSESFAEITRRSLKSLETAGLNTRVLQGDVLSAALPGPFDAIVFFESFHHIPDHFRLLQKLLGQLAPGGQLVFGAEPIHSGQSATMPYPWGLRFDGESMRAVRNFGWMELGFTQSYFNELMRRLGLRSRRYVSADSRWSDVVIARPA